MGNIFGDKGVFIGQRTDFSYSIDLLPSMGYCIASTS